MNKMIVVGEFKQVGVNTIDMDLVVKKWNHLWALYEWCDPDNYSCRLIKSVRKDSAMSALKLTISQEQKQELIIKLNLVPEQGSFKSAVTWRRQKDIDYLQQWRLNKR